MAQQTSVTEGAVRAVFVDILSLTDPIDWPALKYQEVEAWDSLAHMAIVGELEDSFGIMLDTDDVLDMSSYAKALEILAKYGVEIG
jgi:acyl carrier protein